VLRRQHHLQPVLLAPVVPMVQVVLVVLLAPVVQIALDCQGCCSTVGAEGVC
jgi:hypothetical protein